MCFVQFFVKQEVILRKKMKNAQVNTAQKKRLWHRCFPVRFAKFLRTPFFTEHLRWLLLNGCWIFLLHCSFVCRLIQWQFEDFWSNLVPGFRSKYKEDCYIKDKVLRLDSWFLDMEEKPENFILSSLFVLQKLWRIQWLFVYSFMLSHLLKKFTTKNIFHKA